MSKCRSLSFLTAIAVTLGPMLAHAADETPLTSFHPGQLWPDNNGVHINAHGGGILLHNGIYYWFGEHKIEGKAGNSAHVGVHVYSSKNLYNWKDEGIALAVSSDTGSPITTGCILERPKVVHCKATGKFVMWFHLEPKGSGYSGALSGVAVADQPIGPYRFLTAFRPDANTWPDKVPEAQRSPLTIDEKEKLHAMHFTGGSAPEESMSYLFRRDFSRGQMARDMTLFTDDDGATYHIYASEENSTLHLSKLSADCLSSGGQYIRIFPGGFNEGPAIFKHNHQYFLITSACTGWNPNAARLAVADSIWGPWKALGNPCHDTPQHNANTFQSQSTFVLPIPNHPDQFIFMADRWTPANAIDGRYIWLPIEWENEQPVLHWHADWDLSVFNK